METDPNDAKSELGGNLEKESPLVHERLPRIVIIIDELADLMMTVGRDIEEYITRLGTKGSGRRYPSDSCNPTSVGRCHHRTHQGQLSCSDFFPSDLSRRFSDHSGLYWGRKALRQWRLTVLASGYGAADPRARRLRLRSGSPQGDEVYQAAGAALVTARRSLKSKEILKLPQSMKNTTKCTTKRLPLSPKPNRRRSL